jgi:hypothetical protein
MCVGTSEVFAGQSALLNRGRCTTRRDEWPSRMGDGLALAVVERRCGDAMGDAPA